MPYDDQRPCHIDVDGLPADYYPPRRTRMIISAVLAGWGFMIVSSSHPVFFDRVYRHALARLAWMMPLDRRLGDWPTTNVLYASDGKVTV